MNWLRITLIVRTIGIDVILNPFIIDWKNPVSQTLSIKTNMAAKNISVC